ncbi:Transmembrane protein 62 [Chionoecetes opilio]|uniref:Transmembrane protein 62 n=1 Tax=Chionoecetes opilio TaxID=41210 RepID=A0A8J4YHV0_CHIOP|nr:Transmembrane protein 62 [Chionoecetes opilio]
MRVRLAAIVWTLLVLGGASLIGQVVRVLSINVDDTPEEYSGAGNQSRGSPTALDASDDHLTWFIQISDLHLSIFQDATRGTELMEFASSTVDRIRPAVVLASGDLTDAKDADLLGSQQYVEEWATYTKVLKNSGVLNKTTWLDIRGNHGIVTSSEMRLLEEFERASRKSNYTIWFGHYPTSCILSPEPGIRRVMGRGLAYLCGHLHTLGGLVPNMYTRQHTGSLELELGDWKDSRLFRVAAIDHGLFSFIDVRHASWPILLVTNPKHALFAMKHHEPLHLVRESSHIRVLVWSLSPIVEARVRLGGEGSWLTLTKVKEGPLFVTPWDPHRYEAGLHTLMVYARDSSGREETVAQPFSLDGSQPSFRFWPRALLMSNVSMIFQFLFGTMVGVCVLPLCLLRYLHRLALEKQMLRPRLRWNIFNFWLRKLWILVSVDRLFWPLVVTAVYMPIGPWFVGEVIENHTGVVFAWGIFVNRSYLPGSLTYAYGFVQMLTFQLPLIFAVAHCVESRYRSLYVGAVRSIPRYLCCHVFPLLIVSFQMITAYFFWIAYGTMALFLGPLRTWSAILGVILWYQATTVHKDILREAAQVWASQPITALQEEQTEKSPTHTSWSPL